MTTGSIEFACPYCERVTRVPAAFGGKQGKCPGCQRVVEVPLADGGEAKRAEDADGPPPAVGGSVVAATAAAGVPGEAAGAPAGEAEGGPQRPCPFCGESIKTQAKKCKFCGEFLDEAARAGQRAPSFDGTLASVWTRLGARFIDFLLCWMPCQVLLFAGVMLLDRSSPLGTRNEPLGMLLVVVGLVYFVASSFLQWYLIATRGQTLGKRWLGVKIVRTDGAPVDFVRGVILREWITFAILMLPCYIGCIVNMVGYLLILSADRKCLHDQIASTVVIEA